MADQSYFVYCPRYEGGSDLYLSDNTHCLFDEHGVSQPLTKEQHDRLIENSDFFSHTPSPDRPTGEDGRTQEEPHPPAPPGPENTEDKEQAASPEDDGVHAKRPRKRTGR